jgi:O-antigen ligase/cytochrome c-type biogenesis protein CcmH/NrfG
LLSYALLFLVVSARMQGLRQGRRLVAAMVATGVPLVTLGLIQATGWDPSGLVTDGRSPVYATLGRSNFLGAYLAILLPLTLGLALTTRQHWARAAAAVLFVAMVAVTGLTAARAAWLAAGVALASFGILWFWRRMPALWRRGLVAAALAAGAGAIPLLLVLGRQAGSSAARLAVWRAALDLIARRPLLGYGPDAMGLVFPRVYPPQLVYYQGRGLLVDRAHNLLLDWATATGLLGLLAAVALLVVLFVVGLRAAGRMRNGERRVLLVACLSAVAGSTAGNLFSFDVTATATATWLLLALVAVLATRERNPERSATGHASRPLRTWAVAALALVVTTAMGLAITGANVRPLAADMAARAADQRAAAGDWLAAVEAGERAVALWPAEPAHRLALSWACLQQAQRSCRDPIPWLRRAEAELLAARELRPGDYRIWAALGEFYGLWGSLWDTTKLGPAESAFERATALAPHLATLHTAWGTVDLESGRLRRAATRFRRAVDLDATDGYAFSYLGDVELALGDVDAALAAYRQAVHWEPQLSHAYLGLGRCFRQLGRQAAARAALAHALQLEPGNVMALELQRQIALEP